VTEQRGGERENLRHIHSVLALCGLPYTQQPVTKRDWESKNGKMSLKVFAGQLMSPETGHWVDQPLPYGSRARLMLLHTCSEAILQKSPTIEIQDSLTGFIKAMGFAVTGGKNGTLTSFKQQVNALAAGSAPAGGVGAIMVRAQRLGGQAAGMALLLTCGSSQRPARVSRLM
jgi:Plasmid encoded RepA protein